MRALFRAFAIQIVLANDGSGEGAIFRIAVLFLVKSHRHRSHSSGGGEQGHDALRPGLVFGVELDIAIDAWVDAFRAESFEAQVEINAALAEIGIRRIAEGEDRVFHPSERGCGFRHQPLMEIGSGVGRFAIAVSAGDEQHVFFRREFRGIVLCDVRHRGEEISFFQILDELLGEALGIARLRCVKHRHGHRRSGHGAGSRCLWQMSGKKAVEPQALFGCEGGVVGNKRMLRHVRIVGKSQFRPSWEQRRSRIGRNGKHFKQGSRHFHQKAPKHLVARTSPRAN